MPERPPNDERWQEVLSQVDDALRAQGLAGLRDDQRRTLEGELERAVELLEGRLDPAPDTRPPTGSPQTVSIVEGGREADAPPSGGERPDLRVAPEPPVDSPPEPLAAEVRARVVRLSELSGARPVERGRIHLTPESGVEAQQTIFRGATARPYRLHCDDGSLRVSLDGQPAESLAAGQSLDVEARLIRVSANEPARGTFLRL